MKTLLTGIFAALALCGLSIAQDSTLNQSTAPASQTQQKTAPAQSAATPSAQASAGPRIAPGSVIPVQLTKSIDAKKVKTGDEVEAKVTQDMKAGNGELIIPKDTKVVGRVTEAQSRSKEQKESQLGIVFDRAVMKTGGDVNAPMSIQAIISPSYLSGNNSSSGEATGPPQSNAGSNGIAQGSSRAGTAGGSQSPSPSGSASAAPSEDRSGNGAHEPVTGNTQGVLGIPNMTLSSGAGNAAQGSVVTSEKNNVKLESGTMMLLKVGAASPQH